MNMENERYRRNGYNGNVGIIPENSDVVRRRKVLQEENRKNIRRKKREAERLRRKRQKQLRLFCRYAGVIVGILLVIWMVSIRKEKKQSLVEGLIQSDAATTESVAPQEENSTASVQDTVAVTSKALPDYYQKKYIIETPAHYSEEEIEEKLEALAQKYPEFQPIFDNRKQYPEALLNNLCCNPNMLDFALGYFENLNITDPTLEDSELSADIPLFIQWDPRWGYKLYGSSVVGLVGCGPTCMSMVVTGLTKNEHATPDVLADYAAQNGYYVYGAGTSGTFMDNAGAQYGIQATRISLQEDTIYEQLSQGHPIICSMNKGDFTAEGHFIVLVGIEDGKLRINDPNSIERSNMLWDYDKVAAQISNLWLFQLEK